MKKIFLIIMLGLVISPLCSFAQSSNDFNIIPKATDTSKVQEAVQDVGSEGGSVWDKYNKQVEKLEDDLGAQMASGIMTWDTLLDYVVYVVRFLSQIGLVIGACFIIYAGYLYATTIFGGGDVSKGKKAIKDAIIGILIIAFSYAIMKLLTSALIS